jgi:hypothetical protein
VDNGYLAPITQTDLTRGYVTTRWGTFKVWPGEENRIHVLSDFSTKQTIPEATKEEADSGISTGQLSTYRLPDRTLFVLEEVQLEVSATPIQLNLSLKTLKELANCLGCPTSLEDVRDSIRKRMKYRPPMLAR